MPTVRLIGFGKYVDPIMLTLTNCLPFSIVVGWLDCGTLLFFVVYGFCEVVMAATEMAKNNIMKTAPTAVIICFFSMFFHLVRRKYCRFRPVNHDKYRKHCQYEQKGYV